ncbi:hypothetical protein GF412_05565 [Candidatus Micrarchaeota archaeon]|nr:hypothetical protein [Candidatus Micrarchaeota archaeon]MBD3418418.1 hypothetical protein [Candidatus Micrarchaeota archaeon]
MNRQLSLFLFSVILFSGLCFSWTDLGGGVCECDSCSDCTNALNNIGTCTAKVVLNTSASVNNFNCINDPANSDNKIFDCQGHTVTCTNCGTDDYSVYLNNEDNIVFRNCIFEEFGRFSLYRSDNITVVNVSVNNFKAEGFLVRQSDLFSLINSSVYEPGYDGIELQDAQNATVFSNNVTGTPDYYSLYLTESSGTYSERANISSNNFTGSNRHCVYIERAHNSSITGNRVEQCNWIGMLLSATYDSNITGNTALNNTQEGFSISAYGNNFSGNLAANNTLSDMGLWFTEASDCHTLVMEDNIGTGGLPINYTNETVNWGTFVFSQLFLCDADNSVLNGVVAKRGLATFFTDGLALSNAVSAGGEDGFWFWGSENITITGCIAENNSASGFCLEANSEGFILNGNTARNNSEHGFYISDGSHSFTGNRAEYNEEHGFYFDGGDNTNLTSNTAFNNTQYGFFIYRRDNFTIYENDAQNNGRSGFYSHGLETSILENNTATNNSHYGFEMSSSYCNYTNNTAEQNGDGGIKLGAIKYSGTTIGSEFNRLANNTAKNNTLYGFRLDWALGEAIPQHAMNNTLIENEGTNNSVGGIILSGALDNNFTGNNFSENAAFGINMFDSVWNNFTGDFAQENAWLDLAVENNKWGVAACLNYFEDVTGSGGRPINYTFSTVNWDGAESSEIVLCGADDSVLNNITVRGSDTLDNNGILILHTNRSLVNGSNSSNNYAGVMVYDGTENTNITNTIAYGNQIGLYLYGHMWLVQIYNMTFSNNLNDVYVNADLNQVLYVLNRSTFRNPAGSTTDEYTVLTLGDVTTAAYMVNWSPPRALGPGKASFGNRFVEITGMRGFPVIDRAEWSWTDAEIAASGLDENTLGIGVDNGGGWADAGATLDTVANTLTILNLDPTSEYAVAGDTDVPPPEDDDGKKKETECDSDSDCPNSCYYCNIYGECQLFSTSDCAFDEDCADMEGQVITPFGDTLQLIYVCEGCQCVGHQCIVDDDCPPGYECEDGACIPPECQEDSDCPDGYECIDYSCVKEQEPEEGPEEEPGVPELPPEEPEEEPPFVEPEEVAKEVVPLVEPEEEAEQPTLFDTITQGIWIALFILLLLAIIYVLFSRKKKKRKKE